MSCASGVLGRHAHHIYVLLVDEELKNLAPEPVALTSLRLSI
jgi:hypothetical protein